MVPDELDRVNAVIEAAVMGWDLPARVKRLSLPSYRYCAEDLEHLTSMVAVDALDRILGVAAWEPAEPVDVPTSRPAMLLHGLYVDPERQGSGIGTRLLSAAGQAARAVGFDGLLIKASRHAQGFFAARGLTLLPVEDPDRDYPYRFWMELTLPHSGARETGGGTAGRCESEIRIDRGTTGAARTGDVGAPLRRDRASTKALIGARARLPRSRPAE
jgi:GNAT superfamily N-acetyltransferase